MSSLLLIVFQRELGVATTSIKKFQPYLQELNKLSYKVPVAQVLRHIYHTTNFKILINFDDILLDVSSFLMHAMRRKNH